MDNELTYYTYYLILGKSQLSNAKYYQVQKECLKDAIEQRNSLKKMGYDFDKIIIKKMIFTIISNEIDHIYLYDKEAKKVIERRENINERIDFTS